MGLTVQKAMVELSKAVLQSFNSSVTYTVEVVHSYLELPIDV